MKIINSSLLIFFFTVNLRFFLGNLKIYKEFTAIFVELRIWICWVKIVFYFYIILYIHTYLYVQITWTYKKVSILLQMIPLLNTIIQIWKHTFPWGILKSGEHSSGFVLLLKVCIYTSIHAYYLNPGRPCTIHIITIRGRIWTRNCLF